MDWVGFRGRQILSYIHTFGVMCCCRHSSPVSFIAVLIAATAAATAAATSTAGLLHDSDG